MSKPDAMTQVRNGFRTAGLILYAIGVVLLLFGGAMIADGQGSYPRFVGWILLLVATVVLTIEVNRWRNILPGLLVVAAFNGLAAVVSGHLINSAHTAIPRSDALVLTIFLLVSAFLSQTLRAHALNPVLRIGLVSFVFCILWESLSNSISVPALTLGILSLLVPSAYERSGKHKRRARLRAQGL